MNERIAAVYRRRGFALKQPLDLPEGSEVQLAIEGPVRVPARITDRAQQRKVLESVIERMQHNPIPTQASRLTREELHGRP